MALSDEYLLERALVDSRQQAFGLAEASHALSDLGLEIYNLPDEEQKTRMTAYHKAATTHIKKQFLEAKAVCDMVECNTFTKHRWC
jgi:hypothetical protein